jgi:PAS domain S-box-containing protein
VSKTLPIVPDDSTLFEKIQQDRVLLQSIFNRIPGMIYIHDLVNDVNLYRSSTLKTLLGIDETIEMAGGRKIRSLIHQDDIIGFKRAAKQLQKVKDNECVGFSYRMRHHNGKWLWFRGEEYVYDRNTEGKPTKSLGYATDLTSTVEQQEELDRLNKYNEFLLGAAQILSQPDRKYQVALEELAENVSLYFGVVCDISILNQETGIIHPDAIYHPNKEIRDVILKLFEQRTVKKGEGLVGAVIESGKEILFNEVPEEMRVGPRAVDKRIVPISMLYVPLHGTKGVLGSLNVTRLEGQKRFSALQLDRIRRLGDYVSLFVENGLLKEREAIEMERRRSAEQQLEQEKTWAEFKLKISRVLADVDSNLEEALQEFAKQVASFFDVVCDIPLVDEETQKIIPVAIHHKDKIVCVKIKELFSKSSFKIGEGMIGNVIATGEELFAPGLSDEILKKTQDQQVDLEILPSSFCYVPLRGHYSVLGTLNLTRLHNQNPLVEEDVIQIRDLANHASSFIENRILQNTQQREIQLRTRAEQKLEKSTKVLAKIEAETRMILNAIPIYISRISKDLRYLFFNEAYKNRGIDPSSSEGKNVADVVGQDVLDELMVYVDDVLKGNLVNYEYESTMSDGVHRYFSVVLAPEFSVNGSVIGFYSCSTDKTTKVLAEREAKLTQGRFESLSLNSGDAFFFHDVAQNILDVNQVATDMLGYSRDELLTMKAHQIDPVWKGELYQKFLKALNVNTPQTLDTTVIRKDGAEVPVEVRFVKRVEGGQAYIQSLMRDRTEKKNQEDKLRHSEERMRLVFENVEDIISVHDEEGIFESVNKTSQGNTEADVIGTSLFDIYDEKKAAEVRIKYEKLKKTGESFILEQAYAGPDGSIILYWAKFLAIFHDEKFFKAIVIVRDITSERNREQSVMNAVLSGQEQERKRLGAELHDGIGQVLSAIALQVSQIREEVLEDDVESITSDLSSLNDNLQEAIREVRNISHDLMPEVLESFGLKEAVNQICSNLHDRSGINVMFDHVDLDQRYSQQVEVNLYRVTQELLNNILKHASCSKVFVSLMDHGDSVSLTVEDDGVGFDIEASSSGIGLSNVISRINSISGQIDIESSGNSGTLINIDVPKRHK